MKNTIFWDYDGVIADSWTIVYTLWKKILADRDVVLTEEKARASFNGFAWKNLNKLGAAESDKALYSAQEVAAYQNHKTAPPAFPHMKDLVTQCADQYQMCVVTNNQTEVVIDDLKRHGLQDLIIEVQGREANGDKADRIIDLCQKHELSIENSYLITDTVGDLVQAQKINLNTVAVTWGVQSREVLIGQNPDFVFDDPADLHNFLLS